MAPAKFDFEKKKKTFSTAMFYAMFAFYLKFKVNPTSCIYLAVWIKQKQKEKTLHVVRKTILNFTINFDVK